MNHICFNGKLIPGDTPILRADNRGYRYGDALFETMKMYKGKIMLEPFHLERLSAGIALMQLQLPALINPQALFRQASALCEKNQCQSMARIRLTVSRGNGGIFEGNPVADYLIECWPLDQPMNELNENGLLLGIYPDARKSIDRFSHLKTASCMPYVMAALYTQSQKLNDCLLLNSKERIADSVIANFFMIRDGIIYTPSLEEGCVDGVMRKYLIQALRERGEEVMETGLTTADLATADEVFLTNSIRGIRWVKQAGDQRYGYTRTLDIYRHFVQTLWA